MASDIIFE